MLLHGRPAFSTDPATSARQHSLPYGPLPSGYNADIICQPRQLFPKRKASGDTPVLGTSPEQGPEALARPPGRLAKITATLSSCLTLKLDSDLSCQVIHVWAIVGDGLYFGEGSGVA